jgi:hypothetical protein
VTIDAEMHVESVYLCYPVHFLYVSVAMAAVDLPVDMNRVVEKNKIRHILDLKPFHRFVLIKMRSQVFNLRMMNNDSFMAKHAGLKGRNAGSFSVNCLIVAHKTAYSFPGCMNTMTEMNRLLRTGLIPEIIL